MWLFFGLPILVLFIMGMIHASESINKIRDNWNEYRCNPIYIPFAGAIRPDITTADNFGYCINMMGQGIFKYLLDALGLLFKDMNAGIGELTTALPGVRGVIARLRKFLFSFGAQTFGKILTSMSSVTYYIIKIRDVLKRFIGQGYISAFLANAGIDFAMSFVYLMMSIIKGFVYALLAISIVLALFQPELLALAVALASMIAASGF